MEMYQDSGSSSGDECESEDCQREGGEAFEETGPPASERVLGELAAALLGAPSWVATTPDAAAAVQRLALSTLMHDRLIENSPAAARGVRLIDQLSTAGAAVDVQLLRTAARAEGRRVAALPAGPARDAAEAALYMPGWVGEEWMDTGDAAGGFRQLVHFPHFRLGVSRSGTLAAGIIVAEACIAPTGWRVATWEELLVAGFERRGQRSPRHRYYCSQEGWEGYEWGGVERIWFVTADWQTIHPFAGGAVHVGQTEGSLASTYHTTASLRRELPTRNFGGVVFVRE